MPTGLISLWASDFLQYTEDNHSTGWNIEIGLVKAAESTGSFPVDGNGDPATMILFTCDEIGAQLVQLWARDAYGNSKYCETIVLIQNQNPFGNCDPQPYSFAVCLQHWCDGAPFSGAADIFLDFNPAVPPFFLSDSLSLENGCIYFRGYGNGIPLDSAFTILPDYNKDVLNGLSVIDMLRIAQHILGVEPLPSPFAMIAADINRTNSITSFDIVELRKVLVGIYSNLIRRRWKSCPYPPRG